MANVQEIPPLISSPLLWLVGLVKHLRTLQELNSEFILNSHPCHQLTVKKQNNARHKSKEGLTVAAPAVVYKYPGAAGLPRSSMVPIGFGYQTKVWVAACDHVFPSLYQISCLPINKNNMPLVS